MNIKFRTICAIACLVSSTSAQLKYNQSRRDSGDDVKNFSIRKELSDIELANLMKIVDLTINSKEFQPLKISIATLGHSYSETDYLSGRISKFLVEKLIASYQIKLGTDLHSAPLVDQIGLTWLILIENRPSFEFYVKWSRTLWSPYDKYIVIILDRDNSKPTMWKQIFSTIWNRNRVVKILIGSVLDKFKYFYKYNPFVIENQEYGSVQKVLIDEESLFEDFRNLNKYPISVSTFISTMMNISLVEGRVTFSGLDANVMSLLKKTLNADFQITVLPVARKHDPFEEGLFRLDTGKAELLMTTYFVKNYEKHKFSSAFTVGVRYDKLCLIGSSAGRVPKSFMPFLPISLELWPVLIFYNIFISILWVWFKHFSGKICQEVSINRDKKMKSESQEGSERDPPKINPGVIACVDITEMTCSHLKGAETTPQRFFAAGTLCFAVVILGLYESTLISSLSKPFRYRELNTLEDVVKSNLSILTKYTNLQSNTFVDSALKQKVVVVKNLDISTRHVVARNKSVLAIVRFATSEFEDDTEFYDEDGFSKLHIIEECPAEYTLSYIVRRFSPYLVRINKLLLRMGDAGLFEKWYNDMRYPILKAERTKSELNSNVRKKLNLMHYSLTFLYLVSSLLGCVMVFIVEFQFARVGRFWKNKGN